MADFEKSAVFVDMYKDKGDLFWAVLADKLAEKEKLWFFCCFWRVFVPDTFPPTFIVAVSALLSNYSYLQAFNVQDSEKQPLGAAL